MKIYFLILKNVKRTKFHSRKTSLYFCEWNQATSMNLPNTLISINNYDYNWLKIQKVGLFVKQRTKL